MNQRPNIIHIVTDQQRFDTIHAAGNPHIFTPHLNWLMDTGTIFRRAYSDAPICVPARSTMITGVAHYQRTSEYGNWGVPTAADPTKTLPGLLTAAGYQTRAFGKLHYHPARCAYGFEHAEILEDYYRERRRKGGPQPKSHGVGENEMEPVISMLNEEESLTHWVVDRSINFLETRDPSRPFYMQVGFSKPHPPLDPLLSYWQLYQNREVPEPVAGDWSEKLADIPPGFVGPTYVLNGADRFSPQQWLDIRRAYYACITQIDYNLGLLFGRLRELNLLDNTLIVFHSDHGEMLGDHHLGAKTVFLEGSAHVPMLLKAPRGIEGFCDLRGGTVCDSIVTLADLMPTFLAAAGVARPDDMPKESIDMLEYLRGRATRTRFTGAYHDQYSFIDGDWKYLYTSTGGGELLFNLRDDPCEKRNLAALKPDIAKRMHAELAGEISRHGYDNLKPGADKLPVNPAADTATVRGGRWPGWHSRDHTPEDLLH
jgi:arylsulfatase A-like enzyme